MFIGYTFKGDNGLVNMDAVADVWVEGNDLRMMHMTDDPRTKRVFEYESNEEATESFWRLFGAMQDKKSTFWLPDKGFLALEKLLGEDITEFSKSKCDDGLSDRAISCLQERGFDTLYDVIYYYNPDEEDHNIPEINKELKKFLGKRGLELAKAKDMLTWSKKR